jgi:hypothetical protein
MTETKHDQYIFTLDTSKPAMHPPKRILEQKENGNYVESTWMFWLDSKLTNGAFYTSGVWLWEKKGNKDIEMEIAHTHDFDETIGFLGTVRNDPNSLGGEIEFWLEDEKYVFDKSCILFIPRGMKHLPLYLRRIDSPIFHWTAGSGGTYTRSSGGEAT